MHRVWTILEIKQIIAAHVYYPTGSDDLVCPEDSEMPRPTKRHILNCIQVCRDWKLVFTPLLWRDIRFNGATQYSIPNIDLYKQHIRTFAFQNSCRNLVPRLQGCANLRQLSFYYVRNIDENLADLKTVLATSGARIESIEFKECETHENDSDHANFWVVAAEHCPRLRSLTVDCTEIPESDPHHFWSAVSSLETLVLRHYEFWPDRDLAEHYRNPKDYPRLKYLMWSNVNGDGVDTLFVELLTHMPALESLHWSASVDSEADPRFKEIAQLATIGQIWTHLHSLTLDDLPETMTDADLALILGSISPSTLRKLSVAYSMFGQDCFGSLKRRGHFSTIEELDWSGCKDVSTQMAQEILESCPRLRQFSVNEIEARLVKEGNEWICTGLEHLAADFLLLQYEEWDLSDSPEERLLCDIVAEQLSKLIQLRKLDLSLGDKQNRSRDGEGGLVLRYFHFRLNREYHHLRKLNTLKKLEELVVLSKNLIGEDELNWMLDSWPRLRQITGDLEVDDEVAIPLLHARGIKFNWHHST